MIDETFVYHGVPDQLFGTILRPLNEWKELDPQLYTAKAAKYDNRKWVMEQQIDPLGCVWNDVLFLQPIDPRKIEAALVSLGHRLTGRNFYKIPLSLLEQEQTVLWLWEHDGAANCLPNRFSQCTAEGIARHKEIPQVTFEYYSQEYAEARNPLLYYRVPHILYKGILETTNLEIVTV